MSQIQTCLQQKVEREGKLLEALWCGHRPHVDCRVLIFSQSTDDKFPVTGRSHDSPRLSLAFPFLDIHLQISLGLRRDPKQSQVGDKLHDWVGWGGERAHSRTQLSHLVNGKGPQHQLEGNHPVIWRCVDVITDQNNFKVCKSTLHDCHFLSALSSDSIRACDCTITESLYFHKQDDFLSLLTNGEFRISHSLQLLLK